MVFSTVSQTPGHSFPFSTPTSTPSSSSTSVYYTPPLGPTQPSLTQTPLNGKAGSNDGAAWRAQFNLFPGQQSTSQPPTPSLGATVNASSPQPATPPPPSSMRRKGFRFARYQPAHSSPLTRQPSDFADVEGEGEEEDMDDEDEYESMGGHEPSSPLGRMVPSFTIGSGGRRTGGNDSPSFQRRRAQYKSLGSFGGRNSLGVASSSGTRRSTLATSSSPGNSPLSGPGPAATLFGPSSAGEDPHRTLLRERFKQRCFERAAKAREKAVKAKRKSEGFSFDESIGLRGSRRRDARGKGRPTRDGDFGMDEDEDDSEEDDDSIMNDELFRRIMQDVNRRLQHSYRVSFQQEVGSSFDPDMEDVSRWEEDLQVPSNPQPLSPSPSHPPPSSSSSSTLMLNSQSISSFEYGQEDFDPAELEDEELDAYAEEYARLVEEHVYEEELQQQQQQQQQPQAGSEQPQQYEDTLAGLEDIPEDELFGEWNWESDNEGDVRMDM